MAELLAAVKASDLEQTSAILSPGSKLPPSALTAALIAASENGQPTLVNMLLDAGADANGQLQGNFPLRAACLSGDHECVLALLHRSADPNMETSRGTPLLIACQSEGMLETVSLLLDHGAKVDHETKDGFTALTTAVRENKRTLCQLLLKRGADPNYIPDGSPSAVEIAQAKALPDIYSLLMQSSVTSSAEQALADSEQRQKQARHELEESIAAEREKLQQSAAEGKTEVASRVQALKSENEKLLAKYNFKRK